MAQADSTAITSGAELHEQTLAEHTEFGKDVLKSISAISQPVEMSNLGSSSQPLSQEPQKDEDPSALVTSTSPARSTNEIAPVSQEGGNITRMSEDQSAIGPATEKPLTSVGAVPASGPQLVIILLLHSTDTRHPYIINPKYLRRRNVQVAEDDPINLTVYNLKDLIWRDWRDDWETRPASPTSIRLIHMGRMLDDKAHLKDSRFLTGESPHVVHVSIKPSEIVDDEDAKMAKGSTRDRDDTERRSRCRCSVM